MVQSQALVAYRRGNISDDMRTANLRDALDDYSWRIMG